METLKFSTASDVWSFAIVIVEIMQDGGQPYPGMENATVMNRVMAGFVHPPPENCPKAVYEMLVQCWAMDPAKRAHFDAIIAVLDFNVAKFNALSTTQLSHTEIHRRASMKHARSSIGLGNELYEYSNGFSTVAETEFEDNDYTAFGFGDEEFGGGHDIEEGGGAAGDNAQDVPINIGVLRGVSAGYLEVNGN